MLIHATSPVSGLIGYGTIRTKFRQDKPLWPQEIKENKVIWPLRFEIDVEYCLPQDKWPSSKIIDETLRRRARSRQTFQPIEENLANKLVETFPKKVVPADFHDEIIAKLLEIGRLQKFIAEKEYDMDGDRLDAVWRRVERAVPTYVFEVHIKGDLYHALAKVKHAFDIWNSNIFLVTNKENRKAVDKLLSGVFHEIQDRLKFIDVNKVEELLIKKRGG